MIAPREPETFRYDREHVVLLTDWTDEHPERVLAKLKKQSNYYNRRPGGRWARSSAMRSATSWARRWPSAGCGARCG